MPSAVVTCTLTFPELCGGTVAMTCEELTILTCFADTPPKLTEGGVVALDEKFDPLMVTAVPPAGGAVSGTMDLMMGADALASRGAITSLRHAAKNSGTTTAASRAMTHATRFLSDTFDFITFLPQG